MAIWSIARTQIQAVYGAGLSLSTLHPIFSLLKGKQGLLEIGTSAGTPGMSPVLYPLIVPSVHRAKGSLLSFI